MYDERGLRNRLIGPVTTAAEAREHVRHNFHRMSGRNHPTDAVLVNIHEPVLSGVADTEVRWRLCRRCNGRCQETTWVPRGACEALASSCPFSA